MADLVDELTVLEPQKNHQVSSTVLPVHIERQIVVVALLRSSIV
jgi:hypothetical protein